MSRIENIPENVAYLRLIIQASAPQSNSISRAFSKAVQIGEAREIVAEMLATVKLGNPLTPVKSS